MSKANSSGLGSTCEQNPDESAYEAEQRRQIEAWVMAPPSLAERLSGTLSAPAGWFARRLIPHAAIEAVLRGADWLARKTLVDRRLLRHAKVDTMEALAALPLRRRDELAASYHRWALGLATVEGGIAGGVGLFGMAADIPSLILLTLRTVRGIGACYGYREADEAERRFVLGIIGAAGANSGVEKAAAVNSLRELEEGFILRTVKTVTDKAAQHTLGKEAVTAMIRDLAQQLGVNLTRRKSLQSIPIVGIALGAAINWSFINDAAWAARRAYQERWLRERDGPAASVASPATEDEDQPAIASRNDGAIEAARDETWRMPGR